MLKMSVWSRAGSAGEVSKCPETGQQKSRHCSGVMSGRCLAASLLRAGIAW